MNLCHGNQHTNYHNYLPFIHPTARLACNVSGIMVGKTGTHCSNGCLMVRRGTQTPHGEDGDDPLLSTHEDVLVRVSPAAVQTNTGMHA